MEISPPGHCFKRIMTIISHNLFFAGVSKISEYIYRIITSRSKGIKVGRVNRNRLYGGYSNGIISRNETDACCDKRK